MLIQTEPESPVHRDRVENALCPFSRLDHPPFAKQIHDDGSFVRKAPPDELHAISEGLEEDGKRHAASCRLKARNRILVAGLLLERPFEKPERFAVPVEKVERVAHAVVPEESAPRGASRCAEDFNRPFKEFVVSGLCKVVVGAGEFAREPPRALFRRQRLQKINDSLVFRKFVESLHLLEQRLLAGLVFGALPAAPQLRRIVRADMA